jgi:hypothetical protein
MTDELTPSHIHPDAVYQDGQVRLLLGLTGATLARARRGGGLRFTRQGRCILYRGAWLLSWLESAAGSSTGSTLNGRRNG